MASDRYSIRPMTRDELDIAVSWAASEGWDPGLFDADCFYRADPTGFLMGFVDGEPMASISAVKYGESFGFIGLYIVKPDGRGQGYGLRIWQAALDYLAGRTIGLDGVVAQQANYVRSGFKLAHRNIRYTGMGQGQGAQPSGVVPLATVPLEMVIGYDRQIFGGVRSQFLPAWIAQPHSHGVGVMQAQTPMGYGLIRPSQSGYKIGPLFADNATIANNIFQALVTQVPLDRPFYLDVPEVNDEAMALAQHQGLNPVFETARMYRGPAPEIPLEKVFGGTTFELG